jgi:glycine amidinotransferase
VSVALSPERELSPSLVSSWNEWDPLEEVIVGVVEGACLPSWHLAVQSTMPSEHHDLFQRRGGREFPAELVREASRELEGLCRRLEAEGVVVKRPDPTDYRRSFSTPDWTQPAGLYAAMPRDVLLVVGDELIEAPMPWRCRYFEINAYRRLLKEYFLAGARWSSAPKPQLTDELYDETWSDPANDGPMRYSLTEFEPAFDAADFSRCGRDIFYQRSNTTNAQGVEWLRRHLQGRCRLHELHVQDTHPMHIDATFVPMSPGRLLINPERMPRVPEMLRRWEVLVAPPPSGPAAPQFLMSSRWISMNLLSLDSERVLVEAGEREMIAALRRWGFSPIPVPFRHFNAFGGSFHCATLDVRRTGRLETYF